MKGARKKLTPIVRRKPLPPPAPTDYLVIWYDGNEERATRVTLSATHDNVEAKFGAIAEHISRLNNEPGEPVINAIIRITQAKCCVILYGDDEERMV